MFYALIALIYLITNSIFTAAHNVIAKDFMNCDIKYIWNGITYRELENILEENQDIRSYPLLDNPSRSSSLKFLSAGHDKLPSF